MVAQRISKTKLKARMLEMSLDLQENGGEIIVTERDKPVLRITPYREKKGQPGSPNRRGTTVERWLRLFS